MSSVSPAPADSIQKIRTVLQLTAGFGGSPNASQMGRSERAAVGRSRLPALFEFFKNVQPLRASDYS
jgi:hypothetical protein